MRTGNWSHNITRCVAITRRSLSNLSTFGVEILPIHIYEWGLRVWAGVHADEYRSVLEAGNQMWIDKQNENKIKYKSTEGTAHINISTWIQYRS